MQGRRNVQCFVASVFFSHVSTLLRSSRFIREKHRVKLPGYFKRLFSGAEKKYALAVGFFHCFIIGFPSVDDDYGGDIFHGRHRYDVYMGLESYPEAPLFSVRHYIGEQVAHINIVNFDIGGGDISERRQRKRFDKTLDRHGTTAPSLAQMTISTVVPSPTTESILKTSAFFFMFGSPMPAPQPISRTHSGAVE